MTASPLVLGNEPAAMWFGPAGRRCAHRSLDSACCTRIRATDLRDAAKKTARSRGSVAAEQAVLIDIEVLLDEEASEALRRFDAIDVQLREELLATLHYVGTPAGLAGLLSDISSLGIADGVVVIPVQPLSEPTLQRGTQPNRSPIE